jgi:hypothetical protein
LYIREKYRSHCGHLYFPRFSFPFLLVEVDDDAWAAVEEDDDKLPFSALADESAAAADAEDDDAEAFDDALFFLLFLECLL